MQTFPELTLGILSGEHCHDGLHAVEALGVGPEVAPHLAPLKGRQLRPELGTRDRLHPCQPPLLGMDLEVLNVTMNKK